MFNKICDRYLYLYYILISFQGTPREILFSCAVMSKNYSGTSITEMCRGHDRWGFYIPPISACKQHSVLYELPVNSSGVPQPHIPRKPKHWDDDHVKMPFSRYNLYPLKGHGKSGETRWEIICKTLEKPIRSVEELKNAINSYNRSVSKLFILEHFFEEELVEAETTEFFENLLPKIIQLVLRLPEILPGSLPFLKKNICKSISLSQIQVASLLANAFLCTFPSRKEMGESYPGINFIRLFSVHGQPRRTNCVVEKLKCIIHYFRRITTAEPKGVITFERIYPKRNIPQWDVLQNNLGNTRVHIASYGTIEDDGLGYLQVDFANKNVGGGVLRYGCVQEEIRFVICPELLISRLFVEQLGNTEAVVIRGIERFSRYTGYGDTFKWDGNFVDETPLDNCGRRQTALTLIDATPFYNNSSEQYLPKAIRRELSKAYVGFYSPSTDNLAPVATGNWGCGAFGGDANLKTLIQLMACNATHRDLVYYTYGDEELQESFYNMYLLIATNQITTSELWRTLCKFATAKLPAHQLYSFIQQSFIDSKNKPVILENNSPPKKKRPSSEKTPMSPKQLKSLSRKDNINTATTSKVSNKAVSTDTCNIIEISSDSGSTSSFEDIIPSSQPKYEYHIPFIKNKEKSCFDKKLLEENHNEILDIFGEIGETPIMNKSSNKEHNYTLLSVCEKLEKTEEKAGMSYIVIVVEDDSMDVDAPYEEPAPKLTKSKKRISDYFPKLGKT